MAASLTSYPTLNQQLSPSTNYVFSNYFSSADGAGNRQVFDVTNYFSSTTLQVTQAGNLYTNASATLLYNSTYTFDGDTLNIVPGGWTDSSQTNGYAHVINNAFTPVSQHDKILQVYGEGTSHVGHAISPAFAGRTSGTVECWMAAQNSNPFYLELEDGSSNVYIRLYMWNGQFGYGDARAGKIILILLGEKVK